MVFILSGYRRAPQSPPLEPVSGAVGKGERAQEIESPGSAPTCLRTGQQGPVHRRRWPCPWLQAVGEEMPSAKAHVMLPMARSSSAYPILRRPFSSLPAGPQPQSWAGSAILSPSFLWLAGRTLSHTSFSNLQRQQAYALSTEPGRRTQEQENVGLCRSMTGFW